MALRTRYGINCQKVNWGKMGDVLPVGYIEVIPGDTISGKISVDMHSAPTTRVVNTRVYSDLFAFYTPYRLVDDGWKEFISSQVTATPPPEVTDLFNQNFEPRFALGQEGVPATRNTAYQRRTYNLICQKFFAKEEADIPDLDVAAIFTALQRPSTLEVSEVPQERATKTIDVSGATINVDEIRDAFALDQFDKMRQFYGDRYVDYLMALGVKTPWTIQEEPETIGKKHHDWQYRQVSDTTGAAAGQPLGFNAGYFKSKPICDIRRTFIPEHGLISCYAVARADPIYEFPAMNPQMQFNGQNNYWSPEFESQKQFNYFATLFEEDPNNTRNQVRPTWEHLRKGLNENTDVVPIDTSAILGLTVAAASNKTQLTGDLYDDNFDTTVMNNDQHYQATADWRITRSSPLMKHGQQKPMF